MRRPTNPALALGRAVGRRGVRRAPGLSRRNRPVEEFTATLPGHRATYYVRCFRQARNHGPLLTLADAEWTLPGSDTRRTVHDIVTRMQLADLLSQWHPFPVNAARLYGPRGRRCAIGRAAQA
ncbi:MAG: hypothetical protein JNM56_29040 [Planctomycetia bacterium]|nr:hypothetical protein [Planctomycetia bacterium]